MGEFKEKLLATLGSLAELEDKLLEADDKEIALVLIEVATSESVNLVYLDCLYKLLRSCLETKDSNKRDKIQARLIASVVESVHPYNERLQ